MKDRGNFRQTISLFLFILGCGLLTLIAYNRERLGIGEETLIQFEALILLMGVIYVYRIFIEKTGTYSVISKKYGEDFCDNDN